MHSAYILDQKSINYHYKICINTYCLIKIQDRAQICQVKAAEINFYTHEAIFQLTLYYMYI